MTDAERYEKLANERQAAINQSNNMYNDLLNKNTQYSQSVDSYLKNYQQTQNDIYDKQTAFNVELQNQNKERAEREFQKEATASKNAYYDFINPYGVQAEIQAENGLNRAGYSETVKSQAWTTQQNRTAQARALLNDAKLQFDNAIKEAYLNNDTLKAELALKILDQKQQEALRSLTYISDTKQNQLGNNQNLDADYNNRYNTLYNQIEQEKARAEAIRQWEAEMKEQQRQYDANMKEKQKQWEAEMKEKQRQYDTTLAYQKEQAKKAQQQWEKEYALSRAKVYSTGSSGGGSYTSLSDTTTTPTGNNNTNNTANNSNGAKNSSGVDSVLTRVSNKVLTPVLNLNPNALSSFTAQQYYNKNIKDKTLTGSQLYSLLNSAYNNGTISGNDVKVISNRYLETR